MRTRPAAARPLLSSAPTLALALALTLTTAALPAQAASAAAAAATAAELRHITVDERTFHSAAAQRDVVYEVLLPKGYAAPGSNRTYPLVVWLHGARENRATFRLRGGAEAVDDAVMRKVLPQCVVVCPELTGHKTHLCLDHGGRDRERMITADLVEHLEATFRLRGGRDQRALCGTGLGGMIALRIGLRRPEAFGTVAVCAAALLPEDPADLTGGPGAWYRGAGLTALFGAEVDLELWERANPLCAARQVEPGARRGLRLHFAAGRRDRHGFFPLHTRLHEVLAQRGIEHTWAPSDGHHAWIDKFQSEMLPAALRFVGDSFAGRPARADAPRGRRDPADGKDRPGPDGGR